jgi:hypothetical protein
MSVKQRVLSQDDIVGQRITAILVSPEVKDTSDSGMILSRNTYVKLHNSVVFRIISCDGFPPIIRLCDEAEVVTTESVSESSIRTEVGIGAAGLIVGHKIVDIVDSEAAPSFGVVLDNGFILINGSLEVPIWRIGPCLITRHFFVDIEECFRVWDGSPVTACHQIMEALMLT